MSLAGCGKDKLTSKPSKEKDIFLPSLRHVTRPAASRRNGVLMLFVELPKSCSTWWWCAPLPTPRSLQIDWICLNIKISVMGEQLRADCSLLGPQAAKYEGPQMSNIQVSESICCLLVCVCVWRVRVCLCMRAGVCSMCIWNVKHSTSPVRNHESFDAFRVCVPEQFRG